MRFSGKDTIGSLERRLILIVMTVFTLLILSLVIFINYDLSTRTRHNILETLQAYALDGDDIYEADNGYENPFMTSPILTVTYTQDGSVTEYTSTARVVITEDILENIIAQAQRTGRYFGRAGDYYYYNGGESPLYIMDNTEGRYYRARSMTISVMLAVGGWAAVLILTLYMITRLTRPMREMIEQQRRFISDVEHELKTPVSVIASSSAALEREVGKSKWLDYIKTENGRINALVRELLTLVAAERIVMEKEKETIDLSELVLAMSLPLESVAFEHGMTMEYDTADNITVRGIETQLQQLVSVLVSNAITYGEEGGVIRIGLHRKKGRAVLTVYNTGEGIRPENIEKLFHRFYREDKARKGENYGLGLSIAKAVCDNHRGRISVKSEYGRWAEFTVVLPTA